MAARSGPALFNEGDLVGVPCSIQPGAFANERLITVDSVEGPLSGFVQNRYIHSPEGGGQGLVKSAVIEVLGDSLIIRMFGSFFTTAMGLARVRHEGLTLLGSHDSRAA
jgi:hypothetical protein